MFLQEFNKITVFVPQIAIHSGAGGTGFHTGRSKTLFQPVITKGAFIRNFFNRMNKSAAIRTCLYTVPAADTVFFINKRNALGTDISCAYRAYLYTSCLLYTSDAADDLLCVDLGGRRII